MLDCCCWKEPDAAGKIDVTLEPPSTTSVLEVVDAFEQVLVAAATAVPGAPEQTFGMPSWWEVSMQRWCNQHGLVYPEGLWAVLKIGESEAKAGWWLPFRLQPEEAGAGALGGAPSEQVATTMGKKGGKKGKKGKEKVLAVLHDPQGEFGAVRKR